MANICENTLRTFGDKKELKDFSKKTKTKKVMFTFEKLFPIPKGYNEGDKWYNWSIKNWGTKWDAYPDSVSRDEDEYLIEVSFCTAWGPPIEWLVKVSKIYKKLTFIIHYKETGMGFEGVAKVKKGKLEDRCVNY